MWIASSFMKVQVAVCVMRLSCGDSSWCASTKNFLHTPRDACAGASAVHRKPHTSTGFAPLSRSMITAGESVVVLPRYLSLCDTQS